MRQEIKKGCSLESKGGGVRLEVCGVYHGKGPSSVVVYTDKDGVIGKDLDTILLKDFNVVKTA